MSLFNKLKEKIEESNIRNLIINLVSIIIICIIILISWSVFFPKDEQNTSENSSLNIASNDKDDKEVEYNDSIDSQLEKILSKINGVGEVEVMVTYETSAEIVPAINVTKSLQTTEEKDNQGGTRTIKQENVTENVVTVNDQDYKNSPIVIKEIKPIIKGVIVVAEGAGNPEIKTQLIDAVTTIFQIKSHKVKVYEKQ